MGAAQPAVKSYYFGKGYKDLWLTIKETWQMNLDDAGDMFSKASRNWSLAGWYYALAVFWGAAALAVILFGTTWFLILSTLHVIILGSFFMLIYQCFTLLWLSERAYMGIKRIFSACPKCHHKFDLPKYMCPKCNREHTRLIPSSYGILKRTCLCGEKLPSVFFNGRKALPAKCPECNYDIESRETTPICLPIIGGPSVGKTCYLFAATHHLKEKTAPSKGWTVRMMNRQNEMVYDNLERRFRGGMTPDKTADTNPTAFNFFIGSDKWSPEKIVYLYDSAGEAFSHTDNLQDHKYFGFIHGFLFLIDPFSITDIADRYRTEMGTAGANIKPSSMDLEDAFDAMLINLETKHGVKREARINKPCAVVINKMDAFDLEQVLGEPAAQTHRSANGMENLRDAWDDLCRNHLNENGLGNFTRKLDSKFKKVRFYTCSALGDGNASSFEPYRVGEPIQWLLEQADRDFR